LILPAEIDKLLSKSVNMGKNKSLNEIKELFESFVVPEFIHYSPIDSWVIVHSKKNDVSGEKTIECSQKMILYSVFCPLLEQYSGQFC
jgi:hypothetical protein